MGRAPLKHPQIRAVRRLSAGPTVADLSRMSRAAPQRAGDITLRHFCEPWRSERRAADHAALVTRARPYLARATTLRLATTGGPIPVHMLEPEGGGAQSPRVLVVHGWTSEASFMALFGERLVRSGFRVALMDGPAHGTAPQRRASLIDWTRAILEVGDAIGPFEAVVAHSMGVLAALLAGAGGPPFHRRHDFRRYVLISAPNRLSVITAEFGAARGLTPAAQRAFERHLERLAHRPLATFTGANLLAATEMPALLIHATDDHEVPYSNSVEIAAACPRATLAPFDGLGHRRILSAPPVVRAALQWLGGGSRSNGGTAI